MTNKTQIAELQAMSKTEFNRLGFVTDNNSGGYYLAECESCGSIFPSQNSNGGEPIADTGDYSDCSCPNCGFIDPTECESIALAWNLQQLKIVKLNSKLEAAEARITGIEKNLDAALYREKRVERQLLAKEAELAAMRGDAVPVAVVEWSDYIVFGQPPRVAVRELSPGALELAMGKSLFTHGQPAPVVVLDDATVLAWGERNYIQGDASKLRCMIEDAASLGLVKSADGEGD